MRMWKVNPKNMCRNHLLGEHLEMHMFAGSIMKGISISGYAKTGLVEVNNIQKRHEALSREMERRGFVHKSPLPEGFMKKYSGSNGKVSIKNNIIELKRRCRECRKLCSRS